MEHGVTDRKPSDRPSRATSPWLRAEMLGAAAAVICFFNILPNDFCNDGHAIVEQNRKVNEAGQWSAIWTTDYWSQTVLENPNRDLLYRPVAMVSYRLVRMLFGVRPMPHHVVNLFLYALLCALIARLCRLAGGSEWAARVAAVTFAVLPIHTEVINNVVGRADLLAAVGMLVTILCHRRAMMSASGHLATTWRAAAVLAAFGAMGSKESGVGVVAVVPLFDALWFSKARKRPSEDRWLSPPTLRRLAYLIIPAAAYLGLRYYALGGALHQRADITKTINVLVDAPPWQHALGVVQLWGMYWAKTIWPQVLSVNYSINAIRLATGPEDLHVILGAVLTFLLAAMSVVAWRRGNRVVALLCVALVITYAPTANAVVLMQVFMAERIWFVPSVWVALLAGLAAQRWARARMSCVVVFVVLAAMGTRSWVRNEDWRNDGTLYAAAYEDLPDAVGVLYLRGQWLVRHDQYADGVEFLTRATQMDLGFTDAYRVLGQAHFRRGRLPEALAALRVADMQVPGHPPTVAALARVTERLSEADTALRQLRRTARERPDDVTAEIALVRRLGEFALTREALQRFRDREAHFARSAAWHGEYAVTLVLLNRRDEAIDRYRKSIELNPSGVQQMIELAMLMLERRAAGDLDEAARLSKRAETLAPKAPPVLVCRAEVLALRGELDAALALFRRAIEALPPGANIRRAYEERARALGARP